MKWTRHAGLLVLFVALLAAGCGAAAPTPTATPLLVADAFSYCAAVQTIDAPDSRYTGVKVPDAVANGLRNALKIPAGTPDPTFNDRTFWRCMSGKVYACNVGANLPCQTKADINRTPATELVDFCKASPSADVIPMVVTGRATVYSWRCTGGQPTIVKQVTQVDAQGFLASIWHEISPQ